MSKASYSKAFATRSVICFFIILSLLLFSVARVAVISLENYSAVAAEQSKFRINISRVRGTIYDCNMVPLTNNFTRRVAAVLPNPRGILALNFCAEKENFEQSLNSLKINKPTVCDVNNEINSDGIAFTTVYEQDKNSKLLACHLIGYTDSSGHGVSGLQKAYDDFLYSDKYVSAVFTTGGTGKFLDGINPYFENDIADVKNGVVTTIDINIQNAVETIIEQINSGCVIVSEVGNAKIRAMASVPTFDINNLEESLKKENSPMINRAILPYNVGSVFKPCVAAASIENQKDNLTFVCEGRLEIAKRMFRCHNLSGHGNMNLCDAIAQSCNCYFYNLSARIGGEGIYKMASSLSIGAKIKIAENLYASSGIIPSTNDLKNEGELANISIGQGTILASPVSMVNLYQAIATDGCYYMPSVVEKTIKDGTENHYACGEKTRAMSEKTSKKLKEYLKTVITDGTGNEAQPTLVNAAGKTATAQTGRYYEDKTEITNSWFCGFFPADDPRYVIVVMSDSRADTSTASIFAQIADKICELKQINVQNND